MHLMAFTFIRGSTFALSAFCLAISIARSTTRLSILLLTCLTADGSLTLTSLSVLFCPGAKSKFLPFAQFIGKVSLRPFRVPPVP